MYPSFSSCNTASLIFASSQFRLGTGSRSRDRLPRVVHRPTDVSLSGSWERDYQFHRDNHQGPPLTRFPSAILQKLTGLPGLWLHRTKSATIYRAKLRRPGVRSTDSLLYSHALGAISINETATHRFL